MDNFKIWIISLCGATAISSLIKLLAYNSNLKKSVDIFCALFILFYTIIPMNSINDYNFQFNSIDESEMKIELEDGYNRIISESIYNICNNLSVDIISLEIDSYSDDGYLNINSIILDINRNDMCDSVKEKIKVESGLEVDVV